MVKKTLCAATIAAMMLISACSQPTSEPQESMEFQKITCVLDWTPNTNHTGLYVAKKMGYFSSAGLDVDIIQPPEDGATALVASGKAQFGVDFQDSLAYALIGDNKMPITAVAALLQHNTSGILSIKDKNIESPKNMEGKNYATWDMPVEKAIIKQIVEKDGGDFSKVELVPSTVTDVISALQADIDTVWVYYGWDGIASKVKGLATNYFAFKDIDPVFDYYTPVLIANDEFLSKQPEVAKKFLKACKMGYEYAIENPKEAAEILLTAVPEMDKNIVNQSQKWISEQYKAEMPVWGHIDSARWDAFYAWLYQNKLIDEEIGEGIGFSNAFLPK